MRVACQLIALVIFALPAGADKPGSAEQPEQTSYAPDWKPEGLLDAQARRLGDAHELYVSVGGIEVSIPETLGCRVGFREELPIILTQRGLARNPLRITGLGPPGVTMDPVDVEMRKKRIGRVTPAVQTLLPRPTYLVLNITVGQHSGRIPLKLLPEVTYPLIGLAIPVGDPDGIARAAECGAQFVEPVPSEGAEPSDDAWQQTLEAAHARLRADIQLNVARDKRVRALLADPAGDDEALVAETQRLAERWAGKVDCWTLGNADERALRVMPALAAALRRADPEALIFTPVFGADAREPDSAAHALLDGLFASGLPENITGVAFEHRPPALAGDATAPERWAEADLAASLEPIVALMADRGVNPPLWCAGFSGAQTGDPRLDALRAVRDAVIAVSTGAAALLHGKRGQSLFSPDTISSANIRPTPAEKGSVPLLACKAVAAAATQLAGARSVLMRPQEGDCSTALGSEITYRVFRRGDEGIVWIWSNAPKLRHITLRLRGEPQGLRLLYFARTGELVRRQADPLFVARKDRRTRSFLVGAQLAPLEIAAYAFPFKFLSDDWLVGVELGAPRVPKETGQ